MAHVGGLQLRWRKVTRRERAAAMQEAAQLADDPKQCWNHLWNPRAVAGGGCIAVIQSSHVGPEGGQVLVNGTVDVLKALWPAP